MTTANCVTTAEELQTRLVREAEDQASLRLRKATCISAMDAALVNLRFARRRIGAMTPAQLTQAGQARGWL